MLSNANASVIQGLLAQKGLKVKADAKQCTEVRNATFQSRKFYQLELHRKRILKL